MLGVSIFLIVDSDANSTKFTVGVSIFTGIGGWWLPSPKVSKKSLSNYQSDSISHNSGTTTNGEVIESLDENEVIEPLVEDDDDVLLVNDDSNDDNN